MLNGEKKRTVSVEEIIMTYLYCFSKFLEAIRVSVKKDNVEFVEEVQPPVPTTHVLSRLL